MVVNGILFGVMAPAVPVVPVMDDQEMERRNSVCYANWK